MRSWLKLTWVDFKLTYRSIVVVFFTFIFPVLNMLLFGSMYGNDPTSIYGGHGAADAMAPGYIAALVIGSAAFMNLPLEMAARRQLGVLRRFRASPLHPLAVLGSQVTVNVLISLLSAVLLVVSNAFIFGGALPAKPLALLGAILLGCLSMHAVCLFLSNLIHSLAATRAVFMALYFPMLFLSGGTMPLPLLPETIQKVSRFMPLSYVVDLCSSIYLDGRWNMPALTLLSGLLVVCGALAVRFFRWE
jgi:ABC-2 type transport system permease protein